MANPFPFASGDVLTAAELNSIGEWDTYTPALTASGTNPNLGTGSTVAGHFCQVNEIVFAHIFIAFGSSGVSAGSGTYYISLPVNHATDNSNIIMGTAWFYDSNVAAARAGNVQFGPTADKLQMLTTDFVGITVTNAVPFTWSTNDQIRLSINYKAA